MVGEHARAFGRGQTAYNPWHYVPVLARKPGALRNGAPFKDRVLPPAMAAVRRKLKGSDDDDRPMVKILSCAPDDGLQAVEAACREAVDQTFPKINCKKGELRRYSWPMADHLHR